MYPKFSERINADWKTKDKLKKLLDEFFSMKVKKQHITKDGQVIDYEVDAPRSLSHLYSWLNVDYIEFVKRQQNPKFTELLTAAENECERWVVEHGFDNDKQFAKWYLKEYHGKDSSKSEVGEAFVASEIKIVRV